MATTATEKGVLTVREIDAADAAPIAELSGQLGYETSVSEMAQRLTQILPLHKGHAAFVACLNGEVVGWIEAEVAYHLQSPPHVLITGLVVKDGVRSVGVGSRLCAEIEGWSKRQGVTVIRVTSRMTRERAHRFYLREGFTQTKTSAVFEKALS
jgi:GNAT superfamily N-acetyltransferase